MASGARVRAVAVVCAALLALAPACIAPSVVSSSGRSILDVPDDAAWVEAVPADLAGLFESVRIDGPAAASVWRLYYHFSPEDGGGGAYTGAALLVGEDGPAFQTLSGRWRLVQGVLELGEGESARCSASGDRRRLETPSGTVILRRAAVD